MFGYLEILIGSELVYSKWLTCLFCNFLSGPRHSDSEASRGPCVDARAAGKDGPSGTRHDRSDARHRCFQEPAESAAERLAEELRWVPSWVRFFTPVLIWFDVILRYRPTSGYTSLRGITPIAPPSLPYYVFVLLRPCGTASLRESLRMDSYNFFASGLFIIFSFSLLIYVYLVSLYPAFNPTACALLTLSDLSLYWN